MGGDPSVHIIGDLFASIIIAVMMMSMRDWIRRVAVVMLILSGVDGVLKYTQNVTSITMFEACYQVPYVILGIIACGWLVDPPIIMEQWVDDHMNALLARFR